MMDAMKIRIKKQGGEPPYFFNAVKWRELIFVATV